MSDCEQLLGGFWFLKTLFWSSLIAFLLIRYLKSLEFPFLRGGIALIISILCLFFDIRLPFFGVGAREFLAAFFFLSGYDYKRTGLQLHMKLYILPLSLVMITFGTFFYQATMNNFKDWQVIPYAITALLGTLAIFFVSKKMIKGCSRIKEILTHIGNKTLTILIWHFLSFKIVSLLIIAVYKLPINRLAEFPVIEEYSIKGWFILYFMVGSFMPIILQSSIIKITEGWGGAKR